MTATHTPRARHTDPSTSHAAAASVKNTTLTQQRILQVLEASGPMTDEQIATAYTRSFPQQPVSPSGLRTRRSEMARRGLIQQAEGALDIGTTAAGRRSKLWERKD